MGSTFMGLEIARRAMTTQQSALYVTGQNVSNANTPGYTRQRVNFQATAPYPSVGINAPSIPGQMGTGVEAGSIQRVRESFLDSQYRTENNKLGYWQVNSDALSKMESIMNEPSDSGLANTMDQFWQSLQDLSTDPTNSGARSVVRQRGEAVADTFNYLYNSLSTVQQDQKNQVNETVKQINSITGQIDQINKQIGSVEPNGYLPNDLYDERDRLIDQLSSLVNIKVEYTSSGGNSSPIADGKAVVKLVDDSGSELGVLVGASSSNELKVNFDGVDQSVKTITLGSSSFDFSKMNSTGALKALIESYGYQKDGAAIGTYPDMLNELDNMAYTFAKEFNTIHETGMSPNEIDSKQNDPIPFFADTSQANVTFIIDNTGSMNGSIGNVKTNIGSFVDELKKSGLETNLGLVTYGEAGEAGGDPAKDPLTSDVSQFIKDLDSITPTGGGDTAESGLEAIMDPNNGALSYDLGSSQLKDIILVTDAPVHDLTDGKSTYDIQKVANQLAQRGYRLHVVTNLSNTQLKDLSDTTGGLFIDMNSSNFSSELQKVVTSISNDSKKGYAGRIQLSRQIKESIDNIATADGSDPNNVTVGDSQNVKSLANVINEQLQYKQGETADFGNYYKNVIGGMGVLSQEATRMTTNSTTLQQSVDEKRKSVSSVSLDEEMTNMIQYQHAYNAAARMITIQDELLDKIINGMGTGGR
jgi:flagellar hook-associated protein 1 FlgK